MVFGLSLIACRFPKGLAGCCERQGGKMQCVYSCGCAVLWLSSDVHNELSQPWPLPALLGKKQGSGCGWAWGRQVGGGLGTALSPRAWRLAGSGQWVSGCELCGRSSACSWLCPLAQPATLSQPARETCQFYCPAGEITNLEKQLSFGSTEPSTLSSFPSKSDYLT